MIEILSSKEYNLEFDEVGIFQMEFNCLCQNKYLFTIKEYDNGDITLKIDILGLKDKN